MAAIQDPIRDDEAFIALIELLARLAFVECIELLSGTGVTLYVN